MLIVRSLNSRRIPVQGCVLTIGNFDGVHLGHQQIIKQARDKANQLGLPLLLMTFDPNPQRYFNPQQTLPCLMGCAEKAYSFRALGVDVLLCLHFGARLATTSAQDFIEQILLHRLKVRHLWVGDDFRFGAGRAGNLSVLQAAAAQAGFAISHQPTILIEQHRVSSTRIRQLLKAGELEQAATLLGKPFMISGRVTYGDQRGRQWGFPTLNLVLRRTRPLTGVFAVRVTGLEQKPLAGVANLGRRPTVGGRKLLLEVHLLDYDKTVYGHRVCVELLHKIRDEQEFASFAQLQQQIEQDRLKALQLLM